MKKIGIMVIAILGMILCLSCSQKGKRVVEFEAGSYFDKNWEESIGTYKGAVIPDKDTAMNVAISIFDGMSKSEEVAEYVVQSIFYDEQDEIWIVSFWKDSRILLAGIVVLHYKRKTEK
ncbi:MAG: hypothetical protein V8S32_07715 [Lachnospiraceae bacterium]